MAVVVITGAAGVIGRTVAPLLARNHDLRLVDLARPASGEAADVGSWFECSIRDAAAMASVLRGADALIHLAGISTEAPWEDLLAANIDGTRIVLESAHRAGVRRVLLASSIHAGGYLTEGSADSAAVRPDTYYGVSKAAMEALGALYADRFSMAIVSARLCTFGTQPTPDRTVGAWLSVGDTARLFEAAISLDAPGHHIVWGVSDNAPGWFPLEPGRAIGFEPRDDAKRWLQENTGETPANPASDFLGGSFLTLPLGVAVRRP